MWGHFEERNYTPLLLWPSASIWRPFVMVVTRTAMQKTLFVLGFSELQQSQHCLPHFKIKQRGCFLRQQENCTDLFGSPWTDDWSCQPFSLMISCCRSEENWQKGELWHQISMVVCHLDAAVVVELNLLSLSLLPHQAQGWVMLASFKYQCRNSTFSQLV